MSSLLGFPPALQPLRDRLPALVGLLEAGREDVWYAFVTVHEKIGKQATVARAENLSATRDRGVVLRIFAGGRNFEAATNDLTSLESLATELRDRVERADLAPDAPVYTPTPWEEEDLASLHPLMVAQLPDRLDRDTEVHFGVPYEIDPEETTIQDLVERGRTFRDALEAQAASDGNPLASTVAHLRQGVTTTVFVDRHRNLSQSLVLTEARMVGFSPTQQHYYSLRGGLGGFELATFDATTIADVAHMPFALAEAERLKPGRYPVITSPEVTGVLAHEAFGHTQEGDTRMLGRSCATALEASQERVGTDGATIVSNPAVFANGDGLGTGGSYFFDDEGQLGRPHEILRSGRVGTAMNSLINAALGDAHGTSPRRSSGRRESWRRPLFSRQSNTYFTPGEHTLDALIGMVDHGYLAECAAGGMEDPKGMRLTAGVLFLREIRDGALTGKLVVGPRGGHVDLAGTVPEILQGLVAKTGTTEGGVPEVRLGGCMKYHKEYVPAGIGGPWILWEGIQCG